jgi:hypothetical protein
VLFTEPGADPVPGHVGFLAGRYRDGAYSDVWTDVSRCAEGTFVRYAPACTCGWGGRCSRRARWGGWRAVGSGSNCTYPKRGPTPPL